MICEEKDPSGSRPRQVIAAIVSRKNQGLSLTTVWRDDPTLYARAKRYFGRWQLALEEAGVAGMPRTQPSTRQDVVNEIQGLHDQGVCCSDLWKINANLCRRAVRKFGSLKAALAAAGISSLHTKKIWTKRVIIDAIQKRHENGSCLSQVYKVDKALFSAAASYFGNWQSALNAAGIACKKRQRWTEVRVLKGLRLSYRGQPNFHRIDPALTAAAIRYFGNLSSAVEEAGLETLGGRWSKQRITNQIQEYYIQGRCIGVLGCGDLLLGLAAKRHFGTWLEAVKASGLSTKMPPPIQKRTWSAKAVQESILLIAQSDEISKAWKKDRRLYQAAKKYFGSWRQAVLASGFEPVHTRWSHDLIIQSLQERNQTTFRHPKDLFKGNSRLADAARRHFGSKQAALVAAGIATPQRSQRKVSTER